MKVNKISFDPKTDKLIVTEVEMSEDKARWLFGDSPEMPNDPLKINIK